MEVNDTAMSNNVCFFISEEQLGILIEDKINKVLSDRLEKEKNELLSIEEAANLLNLSVYTIYEKTSKRLIPFYKRGKKLSFKKDELLQWVEDGKSSLNQGARKRPLRKETKSQSVDMSRYI